MKTGSELIAEERQRQIEKEGWTLEHDDGHSTGDLIRAAICYSETALYPRGAAQAVPTRWPWEDSGWKPYTDIRDLARAGALIAAEIDRRQRF